MEEEEKDKDVTEYGIEDWGGGWDGARGREKNTTNYGQTQEWTDGPIDRARIKLDNL